MFEPTTTASLVAAVVSVVGVLFGFVTSSVTDYLKDSRTHMREREARDAARRIQIAERRTGFQRETLLSLQEAVVEEARTTAQVNLADEREFRDTGRWGQLLPEELSERARQNTVRTLMLTQRVRDPEVRELASRFRAATARVGISPSREFEQQAIQEMSDLVPTLQLRIGVVLRQLDDDEDIETNKRSS